MKNIGELDNFSRKYYITKITVIKSIILEQTTVHEGDQKLLTAAATAKSLQSCPTLCDPIDSSPPGSPVPGILQARTLGVGCHFLLQCMKVKSESEVAQSCPTLRDPMDCRLPGSSAHGISQAGVLEWGAIAFSSVSLHQLWFQPGPCQLTTSDSSKPNSARSFAVPGNSSPPACWVLRDIPQGKENQFILLLKALETVTASSSTGQPLDPQKTMASRTQNSTTEPCNLFQVGFVSNSNQIETGRTQFFASCQQYPVWVLFSKMGSEPCPNQSERRNELFLRGRLGILDAFLTFDIFKLQDTTLS